MVRLLIIDNHDSFTYNLVDLVRRAGATPIVIRNDDTTFRPEDGLDEFDAVVIAPGPGRPDRAHDVGIGNEVLRRSTVPLLGVCLGHQLICHQFGMRVRPADHPLHGVASEMTHTGDELFERIPMSFRAVRYHSLAAYGASEHLVPIAWSADGELMAVRHRERPLWGVQFHPESICSEHGLQLLRNLTHIAGARSRRQPIPLSSTVPVAAMSATRPPPQHPRTPSVVQREVPWVDPERAHEILTSSDAPPPAAWLDSATNDGATGRYSYVVGPAGPRSHLLRWEADGRVLRHRAGEEEALGTDLLTVLEEQLRRWAPPDDDPARPPTTIPFALGYVGYLSYEARRACTTTGPPRSSDQPLGQLLFADRLLAFDHHEGRAFALAFHDDEAWSQRLAATITDLAERDERPSPSAEASDARPYGADDHAAQGPPVATWRHDRTEYIDLVRRCQDEIRDGETYEVCITTQAVLPPLSDARRAYLALRRRNPAPFGALLQFPGLDLLCASPEQFLHVQGRTVSTKPIKGTSSRSPDPDVDQASAHELARSTKTRAENLMIVDLLRNDLTTVCEPMTVHVPVLFGVESYATVHQLVSTVRGTLATGIGAVGALRATFPGGSMTGAPKERTLSIIDEIEGTARGPYSGACGYFSLDGSAQLAMVIRTAVATAAATTIGAGGAITALSDPGAEHEEAVLKAQAVIEAVAPHAAR